MTDAIEILYQNKTQHEDVEVLKKTLVYVLTVLTSCLVIKM